MCAWAGVSAPPRHSWLGCWGVCVFVCALRFNPATPGWGVRCGRVCLGSGCSCAPFFLARVLGCACLCARSACTPPLLAGVCGVGVCVWAWVSAGPSHSWLGCWAVCVLVCAPRLCPAIPGWGVRCGCVCLGSGFGCAPPLLAGVLGCACARSTCTPSLLAGVCVPGIGFRLRPATPCWAVGACLCLCARSACTPPLLAEVCGVGVCAWARVSAAPRHSWLGCWGVCVLVCALRLYPATPGLGVRCGRVCLGSGFGCAPPLLAGVLGCVYACVCTALVPRHSWRGCAVWVCVLELGFRLRPTTPGWGVGVYVFLCARFACTPPLLAGLCSEGVCVWARVLTAPRLSWLGCWGVLVCVRAPLVLRHSWLGCAVWVCVRGLGFCPPPATHGWGVGLCVCWFARSAYTPQLLAGPVQCGCVRLGSGFGCAPALLAGVLGCLCVCVYAPLVPQQFWLGRAVWACVFGLGPRLRPAIPGWSVGVCVPLCARSACTRLSWLGFVVCWFGIACHLFLCRRSLRVVRATRVCGTRWPLLLGTCPCALVPAGGVPLWRASWPCVVCRASSGPVSVGASVGFPDALVPYPTPGACAPGFTGWLRGARGGPPRTGLIVPAAGPQEAGALGSLRVVPVQGPRDGVVPGGSLRRRSWAACAAVVGVCGPSQ